MTEFLGRPPEQLVPADIRAWDDEMQRRGHGPDWLGVHMAALKFLYRRTLCRPEMVSFLSCPKAPQRLPKVLSMLEVSLLLAAIREPRYRAFYSLIFDTGLRVSEAAALKAGDIDYACGVIHVRHGKGDKERQVKLGERLYQLLRSYWRDVRMKALHPEPLSAESLLFACGTGAPISIGGARNALKLAAQDAGLAKRVTPHVLRHTYATQQLEMGTDLSVIQVQLGHANISSTQIYLHVSTRLIRQAPSPLDCLPPP
jgi:site-specific recombinase XerD